MLKKVCMLFCSRVVLLFFVIVSFGVKADDFLIKGDGFSLTEKTLGNSLSLLPLMDKLKVGSSEPALNSFINNEYRNMALYARAEEEGMSRLPEVQQQIQAATRKIIILAYINKLRDSIEIPDLTPLAKLRYSAEKEKYFVPDEVEVRHLLLKVESPSELPEKRQEIEAYRQRLEDGASFELIAASHSDDVTTSRSGGLLGRFGRGKMVPEFEEAAFSLTNPGDISDVLETKYGLHIVQLVARYPARQMPFEEVKARIIEELKSEYLQEEMDRLKLEIVDPRHAVINKEKLKIFVEETVAETKREVAEIRKTIDSQMAIEGEKLQ
jgi:peptidyl-prolyl cis-trans isomerase C